MREKERRGERERERERKRERSFRGNKASKRISNMSKLLDIYHNVVKYFRAK